jgi:ABC-type bacteriocin/lantibiotic exporter with double-glycine peptidase domain
MKRGLAMGRLIVNPGTVVMIMIFAIPIIAIVSYYTHEVFRTRSNNELKKSMVERGMSAEDIETVINAGAKPRIKHTQRKYDNG